MQGVGSGILDASATSVLALIASSSVLSRVYASFSFGSVSVFIRKSITDILKMISPFIIGAFSQYNLTWHVSVTSFLFLT